MKAPIRSPHLTRTERRRMDLYPFGMQADCAHEGSSWHSLPGRTRMKLERKIFTNNIFHAASPKPTIIFSDAVIAAMSNFEFICY
jgi:hypothetical protein